MAAFCFSTLMIMPVMNLVPQAKIITEIDRKRLTKQFFTSISSTKCGSTLPSVTKLSKWWK
jgi:hypothetical protein